MYTLKACTAGYMKACTDPSPRTWVCFLESIVKISSHYFCRLPVVAAGEYYHLPTHFALGWTQLPKAYLQARTDHR